MLGSGHSGVLLDFTHHGRLRLLDELLSGGHGPPGAGGRGQHDPRVEHPVHPEPVRNQDVLAGDQVQSHGRKSPKTRRNKHDTRADTLRLYLYERLNYIHVYITCRGGGRFEGVIFFFFPGFRADNFGKFLVVFVPRINYLTRNSMKDDLTLAVTLETRRETWESFLSRLDLNIWLSDVIRFCSSAAGVASGEGGIFSFRHRRRKSRDL